MGNITTGLTVHSQYGNFQGYLDDPEDGQTIEIWYKSNPHLGPGGGATDYGQQVSHSLPLYTTTPLNFSLSQIKRVRG